MLEKYKNWIGKSTVKDGKSRKDTEIVQLIEGTFGPVEAADVLLSLVTYKIKFHNLQLLHLEAEDKPSREQSEKRIMELKEAKNRITQIIMDARNSGASLEINSNIHIKVKTTK